MNFLKKPFCRHFRFKTVNNQTCHLSFIAIGITVNPTIKAINVNLSYEGLRFSFYGKLQNDICDNKRNQFE
jgi:hypothetical protein